jgi:hypothetical protein
MTPYVAYVTKVVKTQISYCGDVLLLPNKQLHVQLTWRFHLTVDSLIVLSSPASSNLACRFVCDLNLITSVLLAFICR